VGGGAGERDAQSESDAGAEQRHPYLTLARSSCWWLVAGGKARVRCGGFR
jgi:hypothetical protein